MMMIGAFLGWQAVLLVPALTMPLVLVSVPVFYLRGRGTQIPFAPFLAISAVAGLLMPWWLNPALLNSLKPMIGPE
jgi:prepilin signal peptidase PulO-like enzyme (type II secretory pathway)